jgi:hypothetical protein
VELDLDQLSPEMRAAMEAAHGAWTGAGYADRVDEEFLDVEDEPLRTAAGGVPLCCFCGSAIPSTRYAFRKVEGFERQRKQGGTNSLRLRRTLDEFACSRCIDEVSAGRDPSQGALPT